MKLDAATGAITSLRRRGIDAELADGQINNYLYLARRQREGRPAQRPGEHHRQGGRPAGGLAAGRVRRPRLQASCVREVRVVDGLDRVEIIDMVDKLPVRAIEGVTSALPSTCPNPEVRINSPGAVVGRKRTNFPGPARTGSRSSAGWMSPTTTTA